MSSSYCVRKNPVLCLLLKTGIFLFLLFILQFSRLYAVPSGPVANFTGSPLSGYAPLTVNFTDQSSNLLGSSTSWNWDFGDGGISNVQNPQYVYGDVEDTTSYTVTLIVTTPFGTSTAVKVNYITVTGTAPGGNNSGLGFTADPTSGIAPFVVSFQDTTGSNPTSWLWNFGDGNTDTTQNPQHQYGTVSAPTSYTVTLIQSNAFGTVTVSYVNYINVTESGPGGNGTGLGFSASPTTGFAPFIVNFQDTTGGSPTSWNWNFGDGGSSTTKNPSHQYQTVSAPTSYTVTLIENNSFGAVTVTYVNYIFVTEPGPGGNGTGLGFTGSPTNGNAPFVVNFQDTTGGNPTSWSWNFGDGNTDTTQNPSHQYQTVSAPTSYTVILIQSNAFGKVTVSYVNYIKVTEANPGAGFYALPTSGSAPLLVQFFDTTSNNPNSWSWDFGDGGSSTVENPSHTYAVISHATSYVVRLIVSNAYGTSTSYGSSNANSNTAIVTVTPPAPAAGFYASPTSGTGTFGRILYRYNGEFPDELELGFRRWRNQYQREPVARLFIGDREYLL